MVDQNTGTAAAAQDVDGPDDDGDDVHLRVQNVGGISEAEVGFSDGVTLLSGRNASNKSSLLRALAGVLGGPVPQLKTDADAGEVRMAVDGAEYHLELSREDGETVVTDGAPYTTATEGCELFVALTELNPVRQAVLGDEELYDLLMAPVDTAAIEAEIRRLSAERQALDDRLAELAEQERRRHHLRTRHEELTDELDEVTAALREKRDAVERLETTPAADGGTDGAAELREKRAERSDLRNRIETQEDAIESLETELATVREALDEAGTGERVDLGALTEELEELHQRKQRLTDTITTLAPIVELNTGLLEEDADIPAALRGDDVVDELDPASREVTCWTCGSSVERRRIADQVAAVEELVREKRNRRDEVTERIQVVTERKRELEDERERLAERRDRRAELTAELDRRRTDLTELETELRAVESEIATLQESVSEPDEEQARLAELHDDIGDLEYERGQLTGDIESVESELADIEAELEERPEVEARRETVERELRERRERIATLERELVETFNERMQEMLETLDYRSVERVWLERRSTGDRPDDRTSFELHVVRTTDDGTVYDDTVDSLSKSERAVVGLVVALAGYLAHDVAETVPYIVVDAVEMFDADRIEGLLKQFGERADYVVAAVLPEEREELPAYDTISTASFAADP
jgi:DNA repair exonuclease SbcCD ATPase subunit